MLAVSDYVSYVNITTLIGKCIQEVKGKINNILL